MFFYAFLQHKKITSKDRYFIKSAKRLEKYIERLEKQSKMLDTS